MSHTGPARPERGKSNDAVTDKLPFPLVAPPQRYASPDLPAGTVHHHLPPTALPPPNLPLPHLTSDGSASARAASTPSGGSDPPDLVSSPPRTDSTLSERQLLTHCMDPARSPSVSSHGSYDIQSVDDHDVHDIIFRLAFSRSSASAKRTKVHTPEELPVEFDDHKDGRAMRTVVQVRFKNDCLGEVGTMRTVEDVHASQLKGTHWLVETHHGTDIATICSARANDTPAIAPQYRLIQQATRDQIERWQRLTEVEQIVKCRIESIARQLSLQITVHRCELQFDKCKTTAYYSSEAKVPRSIDLKPLVHEFARILRDLTIDQPVVILQFCDVQKSRAVTSVADIAPSALVHAHDEGSGGGSGASGPPDLVSSQSSAQSQTSSTNSSDRTKPSGPEQNHNTDPHNSVGSAPATVEIVVRKASPNENLGISFTRRGLQLRSVSPHSPAAACGLETLIWWTCSKVDDDDVFKHKDFANKTDGRMSFRLTFRDAWQGIGPDGKKAQGKKKSTERARVPPTPPPPEELNELIDATKMPKVATVEFKYGRTTEFGTEATSASELVDVHYIVELQKGIDLGRVLSVRANDCPDTAPKHRLVRIATREEVDRWYKELVQEEKEAMKTVARIVDERRCDLTIRACEFQFDKLKLTVHFSSTTDHPDFRQVVHEVFKVIGVRIWMNNCCPRDGQPGEALDEQRLPPLSSTY